MAEPRKIFRIEETPATRFGGGIEPAQAPTEHAALLQQLSALRALLKIANTRRPEKPAAPQDGDNERLTSELNLIAGAIGGGKHEHTRPAGPQAAAPMTRITHELDAVVKSTDQATQKILAAAEEIDQVANDLSASLKGKVEQGFAQDIQDLVIRIFEACNFQDLAGQRVGKVMATLSFIEDHIARVLDEFQNAASSPRRDGAQRLHGPRLDSDHGHASQSDIDAMFA